MVVRKNARYHKTTDFTTSYKKLSIPNKWTDNLWPRLRHVDITLEVVGLLAAATMAAAVSFRRTSWRASFEESARGGGMGRNKESGERARLVLVLCL